MHVFTAIYYLYISYMRYTYMFHIYLICGSLRTRLVAENLKKKLFGAQTLLFGR